MFNEDASTPTPQSDFKAKEIYNRPDVQNKETVLLANQLPEFEFGAPTFDTSNLERRPCAKLADSDDIYEGEWIKGT